MKPKNITSQVTVMPAAQAVAIAITMLDAIYPTQRVDAIRAIAAFYKLKVVAE